LLKKSRDPNLKTCAINAERKVTGMDMSNIGREVVRRAEEGSFFHIQAKKQLRLLIVIFRLIRFIVFLSPPQA
jgi:hypothetical protein